MLSEGIIMLMISTAPHNKVIFYDLGALTKQEDYIDIKKPDPLGSGFFTTNYKYIYKAISANLGVK